MTMYQTVTAEWNCTKCSVTNRKLVPKGATEVKDRCAHCRTRHLVSPGERPVRWRARAA
jgi:DNA-directed RNA polymerase subunit RPC12/RpoP